MYLSNREISILLWFSIFLIWIFGKKEIRDSLRVVLKGFISIIGVVFILYTFYVCIIIFILLSLNLWHWGLLKDTLIWFFSSGILCFFTINEAEDIIFFRKLITNNLKLSILLSFIINFYTFSLLGEIFYVPFMTILGVLYAYIDIYKQDKPDYLIVYKVLNYLILTSGVLVIAYVLFRLKEGYSELFTSYNLQTISLPTILTILIMPFLYLLALYMQYEILFSFLKTRNLDFRTEKLLRKEIVKSSKLNINKLQFIKRSGFIFNISTSKNIDDFIKSIQ